MTQSNQNKTNSGVSNGRLGFVLFTVALVFFVGIITKKLMFG
jgi:hypothetical protein